MLDRAVLGKQLRFWSLHCVINAAPSFGLALLSFNALPAILGMLAGIATFIAGYTVLTSTVVYQQAAGGTLLGRAVRIGTRIRLWLALISGLVLVLGLAPMGSAVLLLAPDFWAGLLALTLVSSLLELVAGERTILGPEGSEEFLPTYLVTVTEGLILSFTLVFFIFCALLVLQRLRNRRGGAE